MLKRIAAARSLEWPRKICPTMVCGKDNDTNRWSSSDFQGWYLHAEENCCCKILSGPGGFTQLGFVGWTMIHTGGPLQVFIVPVELLLTSIFWKVHSMHT